ncbi:hypothetical protein Bca4012_009866 [Brassica carinata]|uniref:G domain-containing protein n=1 Tax=Brassica carinata TaxID=52824 RepID=A0A8X7V076_BRACI|nr:hypothetical protein Bca52824_035092 [Brassica carinata]
MTVSKSPAGVMEELNVSTTIGMEGIPLSSREAAVAWMPSMIEKQATAAVEESDVIVFVVDGQTGPTGADVEIADWLRKYYSHKNIILAVNKCESPRKGLMQASEFWSLGQCSEAHEWHTKCSETYLTLSSRGAFSMDWIDTSVQQAQILRCLE